MTDIDPQLVAILAIASIAVSILLAVVVVLLGTRLRAVRRAQRRAFGRDEVDVVDLLGRHGERLDDLAGDIEELRGDARHLHDQLRGTVSRVVVARYDAFEDTGGALSFSAALLDDHGHGVVVSAINGRSETRCYAKEIVAGSSEHSLTDEENRVIDAAIAGRGIAPPPSESNGRRRRRKAES